MRIEGSRLAKALAHRWVKIPEGALGYEGTMEGDFTFFKKDMGPVVGRHDRFLREWFERGLWGYEWVRGHKPSSVVVWNDAYPLTRGACIAARDLGIPSIEVIHGLTHVYRIGHWETKPVADWKLGTQEYKMWAEFYGLKSRVVVTGAPLASIYAGVDVPLLRETARSELMIPPHAPTVCFLTDANFARSAWADQGYSVGSFVEFAKAWAMIQRILPDVHLVVKLHPQEFTRKNDPRGPEKYEAALKECQITNNYSIVDDNLPLALAAADLTTGIQSTAMSLGLMLGIPGVVLGYEPFFPTWLYEGRGIKVVRDGREWLRVLVDLLAGNGMEELITETEEGAKFFTGNMDGGADRRCARAIELITDGKEPDDACWA